MIEHTIEEDQAEQLFKEIIAGPRTEPEHFTEPIDVQGFLSALIGASPSTFTPTEEEWAMICKANESLSKKIKADEERKAILDRLGRLWELHPQMTLGKLILSVVEPAALHTLGNAPLLSALEVVYAQAMDA